MGLEASGALSRPGEAEWVSATFSSEGTADSPPGLDQIATRSYGRVYRVSGRGDTYDFLRRSVEASGGRVLYTSADTRAPLFLGVTVSGEERVGILAYVFRATQRLTKNRPADEHRLQIKYGDITEEWRAQDHPIGRDIAGVDTTIMVGAHLDAEIFVGLDPVLYDPLPMGISVELKQHHVDRARDSGWFVWERENVAGRRRGETRSPEGLETLVAFRPERFLDYVRLEREASDLSLDPPLRYSLAEQVGERGVAGPERRHALEETFALTSRQILDMISERHRLGVAVKGGVAEHHLARYLEEHPSVEEHSLIDADDEPDFDVWLRDGRHIRVECKNVSPERYASGQMKVEVQKTRGRAPERLYEYGRFDVLASCVYPTEGEWSFRFRRAEDLEAHETYPDRIRPIQRIDEYWATDLDEIL